MLEVSNEFNDEQKAYIRKYAAGLLIVWAGPAITEHIQPDTMDGFEPPENLFDEDTSYAGSREVGVILDKFLDELAVIAGFKNAGDAMVEAGPSNTVYMKYPVMKE